MIGMLAALALTGCAVESGGPTETRQIDIEDVTAVDLSTSGELTVRRGETPSLTVTAGERTQDRLVSKVRDGILVLSSEKSLGFRVNDTIRYELVVTELHDIAVSGSGDVTASDITGDDLRVLVEGSGDVQLAGVDAEEVRVSVQGSGDVELSGRARSARVSIEGSGNVDLERLSADDADVIIEGSGEVDLDVHDRLTVSIRGSGTVTYSGDPTVSQEISGSGEIQRD